MPNKYVSTLCYLIYLGEGAKSKHLKGHSVPGKNEKMSKWSLWVSLKRVHKGSEGERAKMDTKMYFINQKVKFLLTGKLFDNLALYKKVEFSLFWLR